MNLEDLGYNPTFEEYRQKNGLDSLLAGRVTAQHRERYVVKTEDDDYDAELLGNLRYTAASKNDLPSVGDWVAISAFDEHKALIHAVFPRYSVLERQAVGKFGEKQIIATNIDYALIVQSVNRDFNINRLERYLALCHASGIKPIIVITKTDLTTEQALKDQLDQIRDRIKNIPILPVSNETRAGIEELNKKILKGKTYCLLGSSGVGKSSLVNSLGGDQYMKTDAISERIDRGKHITTHRELVPLGNGAILIDNPGMREVGITEQSEGLENTFSEIYTLAHQCKFSDCTHTSETGCAVLHATETGELEKSTLENFYKMNKEQAYFTSTVQERKIKDKKLGKIYREAKDFRKNNKY